MTHNKEKAKFYTVPFHFCLRFQLTHVKEGVVISKFIAVFGAAKTMLSKTVGTCRIRLWSM